LQAENQEAHFGKVFVPDLDARQLRRLSLLWALRDEVAEVAGGIDAFVLCFHYRDKLSDRWRLSKIISIWRK
jgi:hypothetical protein